MIFHGINFKLIIALSSVTFLVGMQGVDGMRAWSDVPDGTELRIQFPILFHFYKGQFERSTLNHEEIIKSSEITFPNSPVTQTLLAIHYDRTPTHIKLPNRQPNIAIIALRKIPVGSATIYQYWKTVTEAVSAPELAVTQITEDLPKHASGEYNWKLDVSSKHIPKKFNNPKTMLTNYAELKESFRKFQLNRVDVAETETEVLYRFGYRFLPRALSSSSDESTSLQRSQSEMEITDDTEDDVEVELPRQASTSSITGLVSSVDDSSRSSSSSRPPLGGSSDALRKSWLENKSGGKLPLCHLSAIGVVVIVKKENGAKKVKVNLKNPTTQVIRTGVITSAYERGFAQAETYEPDANYVESWDADTWPVTISPADQNRVDAAVKNKLRLYNWEIPAANLNVHGIKFGSIPRPNASPLVCILYEISEPVLSVSHLRRILTSSLEALRLSRSSEEIPGARKDSTLHVILDGVDVVDIGAPKYFPQYAIREVETYLAYKPTWNLPTDQDLTDFVALGQTPLTKNLRYFVAKKLCQQQAHLNLLFEYGEKYKIEIADNIANIYAALDGRAVAKCKEDVEPSLHIELEEEATKVIAMMDQLPVLQLLKHYKQPERNSNTLVPLYWFQFPYKTETLHCVAATNLPGIPYDVMITEFFYDPQHFEDMFSNTLVQLLPYTKPTPTEMHWYNDKFDLFPHTAAYLENEGKLKEEVKQMMYKDQLKPKGSELKLERVQFGVRLIQGGNNHNFSFHGVYYKVTYLTDEPCYVACSLTYSPISLTVSIDLIQADLLNTPEAAKDSLADVVNSVQV